MLVNLPSNKGCGIICAEAVIYLSRTLACRVYVMSLVMNIDEFKQQND
ncbi:hypothetical protein H6G74_18610 [Nostoc spongiaeforme FACHB-130]|uniref:Uncharacterized protein n=1 Tax=Nostoc spongiaeforme FACHB-130 TaxID=1357510 RepID=A0ABR8FY28_9NOSO|nr:hypothetical protein [Nostoc spongiaeforme]MBD2596325.1 hypothetical protein [Nostoc spongiaeforme FACHB-130]